MKPLARTQSLICCLSLISLERPHVVFFDHRQITFIIILFFSWSWRFIVNKKKSAKVRFNQLISTWVQQLKHLNESTVLMMNSKILYFLLEINRTISTMEPSSKISKLNDLCESSLWQNIKYRGEILNYWIIVFLDQEEDVFMIDRLNERKVSITDFLAILSQ